MVEESSPERRDYMESIMRMRSIEGQVTNIQNQLRTYESALIEVMTTKEALDSLKKHKKDEVSLLPLGSGVFADGVLKKKDRILIDVGAGALLEKTVSESLKMLEERETNIRQNIVGLQNIISNLEKSYLKTGQKIQELEKKV